MRKVLVAVLILFLIVLIGAVVFVITFDINRYKSDIVQQITKTIGYPIEIGSLKLSLKHGLSLQVDDFKVHEGPNDPPNSFRSQAKRFFLKVEFSPLLKREIQVSECILESPELKISSAFTPVIAREQSDRSNPSSQIASTSSGKLSRNGAPSKDLASNSMLAGFHISTIRVSNGSIRYEDVKSLEPFTVTIENIELELKNVSLSSPMSFRGSADLLLGSKKHFSATGTFSYPEQTLAFDSSFGDSVKASGRAGQLFRIPVYQVKATSDNLDIASFYTAEQKQKEYFSGMLSANVQLSASGRAPEDIKGSLSGSGQIRIKSGALKNRNILRENLEKITEIPGMNLIFESDLGAQFQPLLSSPDTAFETLETDFRVVGRRVTIHSLNLAHPHYDIRVSGLYFMNGSVDLNAYLSFGTALSTALVHKVKELTYFATPEGQIVIPFVVQGAFPGAMVRPNVGNLVGQAIQNIAPQLIDKALAALLKPKKGHGETSQTPNETNTTNQAVN